MSDALREIAQPGGAAGEIERVDRIVRDAGQPHRFIGGLHDALDPIIEGRTLLHIIEEDLQSGFDRREVDICPRVIRNFNLGLLSAAAIGSY